MTGQLELLIFAYPDETSADEALKKLKQLKKDGLIGIVNAAVIVKDEKGKSFFPLSSGYGGRASRWRSTGCAQGAHGAEAITQSGSPCAVPDLAAQKSFASPWQLLAVPVLFGL